MHFDPKLRKYCEHAPSTSIQICNKPILSLTNKLNLTLSYLEGTFGPSHVFLPHPETAQTMKLKLSDFKGTCLRHILQVIHFEVVPWQQNYKRYHAKF